MLKISYQTKTRIGAYVFIFLALAPILFWLAGAPFSARFTSPFLSLTSFGQISGLVGLAALSLSILLAARFGFFEDYFGGLDKVYKFHHFLNGAAFLLILFHPLVLAAKYILISTREAALFLLPSAYWPQNFGIAALLGLMIFLFASLYFRKLSYQLKKLSHKFLGFAYILVLFHGFLIASDISRNFLLWLYFLSLAVLAVAAFVWRGLLSRWFTKKYQYKVAEARKLSGQITEIEMEPIGEKLIYFPGQFVFVSFAQPGIDAQAHPFTLVSSPDEQNLKIAVKSLGDFTSKISDLKPGALAKIEGPFGRFSFGLGENDDQIWIAGGIGITPFLGMMRSLKNSRNRVDLYYCAKNKGEMVFLNEMLNIAREYKNIRIISYCDDEQLSRLNAEVVQKISGGLDGKKILLCGPPQMSKALKKQLKDLGAAASSVRSEEFQLL